MNKVPLEQLQDLAARLPPEPPKPASTRRGAGQPFDLDTWIADHGIEVRYSAPWGGGRKLIIRCVWDPANHDDKAAYIVQHQGGGIGAGCHHNTCQGKGWSELREVVEPGYRYRRDSAPPRGGAESRPGPATTDGQSFQREGQVFVKGWTWDDNGLYRVKDDGTNVIALNRPVRPVGIVKAGDTRYLELDISGATLSLSNVWVGTAKNAATKALSAAGLAFTDKQAVILQEFVADALSVGVNLPVKEGAELLGWHGDQLVLGQPEDALMFVPRDDTQYAHGFGKRVGDEHEARWEWQSVLEAAPPAVWAGVGAAIGSPFLYLLPDQYHVFIAHLLGDQSSGKSTIARFSAATYGNPLLLLATWDTTHVGLERLLTTCRHLPAFIDETGANVRQDNLGPMVMMVAGGIGRTRGAVDGMRATARWRNVVLSTGETAPTQGSVGGVHRRVVLVHSALKSIDQVIALDRVSEEFYGWPAVWLRDTWTDRGRWTADILSTTAHYESLLEQHAGSRRSQAKCWAVLDAGARAMAEVLGIDSQVPRDAIWAVASDAAGRQADQLGPADRLLWAVADDVVALPKAYQPESIDWRAAFRGRQIDRETVAVLRTPLVEMARRVGVPDLDAALSVLKDRGSLDTEPGRLSKQVRMGRAKARCHVFRLGDFAGGEEDVA
jgi:hypothetical protein